MEKFELLPQTKGNKGHLIDKRRILLGRAEACDIIVPFSNVSAIHAVIEIGEDSHKIFDMNSTNGTYVGGKRVISTDIKEGDVISFANHSYTFKKYMIDDLPPILDMLDGTEPSRILPSGFRDQEESPPPPSPKISSGVGTPPEKVSRPRTSPIPERKTLPEKKSRIPGISKPLFSKKMPKAPVKIVSEAVYPLAADPKAEMSEYIFEDIDTLYPIFQYQINQEAVEVIILFQDRIYSVDYLPKQEMVYHLVGNDPQNKHDVEYARLPRNERVSFIEVKNNEIFINVLQGYQCLSISGKKQDGNSICLLDQDILRLAKDDLQIFIRKTESPPMVKTAPFFRRNKDLKKYLFMMMIFLIPTILFISSLEINKEKDKEKNPERIATILYKKKLYKKPKPKPKPKKKLVVKKEEKKPLVKPKPKPPKKKVVKKVIEKPKPVVKKVPPKPVVKKSPPKVKINKPLAKKRPAKKIAPPKKAKPIKAKVTKRLPKVAAPKKRSTKKIVAPPVKKRKFHSVKSKGAVDTYKAANFKSTISSLLAKGGNTSSVKSATSKVSANFSNTSVSSVSESATLKTAKIKSAVGSVSGAASGKLDSGRGTQGIVSKKDIYTAGVPYKTVILGGMDPDVIKRILLENLPQFRYCYQKELDRKAQQFNGMVRMDFVIGASGHVTKTGLTSVSGRLPASVKSCVVKVLKGIKFPEPAGGGVVEVSQPFNFYPRIR
ncbi:MAG: AgmX/PglI C-terminal domain-containing protein [Halobacteriovoraceae bacterium]|nr:AgmX/PglI C-terminal domain-containing protein [Halobacteriovoraceae bacterium]